MPGEGRQEQGGAPFRLAEFDIEYGTGVSKSGGLLDLALPERDLVQKSGSFFSYGELRLGQGRNNSKQYISEHPHSRRSWSARSSSGSGSSARVPSPSEAAGDDAEDAEVGEEGRQEGRDQRARAQGGVGVREGRIGAGRAPRTGAAGAGAKGAQHGGVDAGSPSAACPRKMWGRRSTTSLRWVSRRCPSRRAEDKREARRVGRGADPRVSDCTGSRTGAHRGGDGGGRGA